MEHKVSHQRVRIIMTISAGLMYLWMYIALVKPLTNNLPLIVLLLLTFSFSMFNLWRPKKTWYLNKTQTLINDNSTDDVD